MKGLQGQIQSQENNNESQRSLNSKGFQLVHRYDDLFEQMYKRDLTLKVETNFIVSNKFIQKWKQYCLSESISPISKPPIIQDEIFDQGKLKSGLKYKNHYQILDLATYELLQPFVNQQNQNQRSVKWQNRRQKNQITPFFMIQCNYLILNPLILRKIDCGYLDPSYLQYKTLSLKDQTFLYLMIDQIFSIENTDINSAKLQLWHLTVQTQIPKIYSSLRTKLNGLCFEEYEILNFGKQLKNTTVTLSDVAVSPQKMFFILQEVKNNTKPIFIENFDGYCRGCKIRLSLQIQCPCGKIRYCSENCRKKDLFSHQPVCSYAEERQFNKPIIMSKNQQSVSGRVGLKNLGNTCYMNACLQCLSNTTPLREYFLKSFFQNQINKTNELGTKGRLAKTYAKFIRDTWCGISPSISPTHLKTIIGKINPNFSGYNQQDAQQFFSFLIDGIHEDLNLVINRQNIQIEEDFSKPQAQLAKLSWKSFLGRNQSIITDLITGQYISSLGCPDCNKKSLKFETFNTVTLPIPIETLVRFFVIHQNQIKKNVKGHFKYTNLDPTQWIKNACEAVKIKNPQRFLLYVVTQKENIYQIGRDSMQQIVIKIENDNKNLFLIEKTDQEMLIPKNQLLQLTINMTQPGNERKQLYFKFPMFFNKKTASQYEISKRILKYIYNQAYNDRKGNPIMSEETEQYIKFEGSMVRKQLFKVYLKFDKKIQRITKRTQARFGQQILLQKKNLVIDLLTKYNVSPSDCEIEIRFQPFENTTEFTFHRMKKYEEHGPTPQLAIKPRIPLQSCFKAFSESQVLMEGNEWYCPNCKQPKRAVKYIKIYRAPRILVIQLKRFRQRGTKKQKIDALVDFPFELDLSKYVIDQKPIQAYRQEIKDGYIKLPNKIKEEIGLDLDSKPCYELYAVTNHMGELGGGHYTAFAKNYGDWIKYNDNQFSDTQPLAEKIVTQSAFLLFYQRKIN